MTLGEAFLKRLRGLLEKKKVTLHKFLKDNCIARSTIVNIEKGNTKSPTLAVVYQVAFAFDMTPVEFLNHPLFLEGNIDFD